MSNLYENLGEEIELQEGYNDIAHHAKVTTDSRKKKKQQQQHLLPSTALSEGKEKNCAFCLGGQKHEDCWKVQDTEERKNYYLNMVDVLSV